MAPSWWKAGRPPRTTLWFVSAAPPSPHNFVQYSLPVRVWALSGVDHVVRDSQLFLIKRCFVMCCMCAPFLLVVISSHGKLIVARLGNKSEETLCIRTAFELLYDMHSMCER